jgi:hypothetical protein
MLETVPPFRPHWAAEAALMGANDLVIRLFQPLFEKNPMKIMLYFAIDASRMKRRK